MGSISPWGLEGSILLMAIAKGSNVSPKGNRPPPLHRQTPAVVTQRVSPVDSYIIQPNNADLLGPLPGSFLLSLLKIILLATLYILHQVGRTHRIPCSTDSAVPAIMYSFPSSYRRFFSFSISPNTCVFQGAADKRCCPPRFQHCLHPLTGIPNFTNLTAASQLCHYHINLSHKSERDTPHPKWLFRPQSCTDLGIRHEFPSQRRVSREDTRLWMTFWPSMLTVNGLISLSRPSHQLASNLPRSTTPFRQNTRSSIEFPKSKAAFTGL